ncbi:MAG: tetraacyldisaccharide 4'-kinase [bacterium]
MTQLWYGKNPLAYLLLPLSLLFYLVSTFRRILYRLGIKRVNRFNIPVVVVRNISVGGTGKTPLVIWLAAFLKSQGHRPGIVARGYGGKSSQWPQQVRPDSDPEVVGDEAVLLAARCECPVCVGPDRSAAVRALEEHTDCDIVISDDGLQHYAMDRDIEIAVVDGERKFGNRLLLPAGPLRETVSRLGRVSLVISLGDAVDGSHTMMHRRAELWPLHGGEPRTLTDAAGARVQAVAGIGNPQRFFNMLQAAGLEVVAHPFRDHHQFQASDFSFAEDLPVLMTEKDAVKCRDFGLQQAWVVRVAAQPDNAFIQALNKLLQELNDG